MEREVKRNSRRMKNKRVVKHLRSPSKLEPVKMDMFRASSVHTLHLMTLRLILNSGRFTEV